VSQVEPADVSEDHEEINDITRNDVSQLCQVNLSLIVVIPSHLMHWTVRLSLWLSALSDYHIIGLFCYQSICVFVFYLVLRSEFMFCLLLSLSLCVCVCVRVGMKTVLCGEKCAHMMTLWGMSDLWGIFPFPTRNSSSSPRIKKF